jgi:formylglycine-generating enzyme required for sulfatase activity
MRKWVLLSFVALGLLFVFAACTGSTTPTTSQTPAAAGDCTATNMDGAETIAIPAGTFKMGSLATDPGAMADEQPQHDVTLSCYNIYKKEVTNAMFNKCVEAGACVPVQARVGNPTSHINDPAFADYPVVGVDYNMASEYCAWAGGRLPTEAEWEYAARGADTLTYPWGNSDPVCTLANSKGCLNPEDTQKVGFLDAGNSPFKIMDMAGNAWEWVFDWYAKDGYSKSTSTDPTGPVAGFWKVVRGGGYNSIPAFLRSASRHSGDPYKPYYNVGFRCVTAPLTLPDTYNPPNPNLHQIPMDGPVDDDDPGTPQFQVQWGVSPANCPDGNGNLHFTVTLLPHPDVTLISFNVDDGANYTCTWDDGSQVYQCVGPDSPNLNPNYTIKFCTHIDGEADHCFEGLQIPRPQNCGSNQYPIELHFALSCPVNGNITVDFTTQPDITWDKITIGNGTPMSCSHSAPNVTKCLGPDVLINGMYVFYLEGKDYIASISTFSDLNCPQGNTDLFTSSLCSAGIGPALRIDYGPVTLPVISLAVNGVDIPWVPETPGGNSMLYDLPPELWGKLLDVAMCIGSDSYCVHTGALAVDEPVCTQSQWKDLYVSAGCYQGNPVAFVVYAPPTRTLQKVIFNSSLFDLNECVFAMPGYYQCPLFTEWEGTNVLADIQIDNEMISKSMDVPVCTPPPTSCGCSLGGVDCINENTIGFTVQTCPANPAALESQSVTATDGITNFSCMLTNQVGQAYCGGAKPITAGNLQVCYIQVGNFQQCCTLTDFASKIPVCVAPPPEPDQFSCSSYKNSDQCNMDSRCQTNPSNGQCVNK